MLEFLVGAAVWGGVLVLVLMLLVRRGSRERRAGSAWTHDQMPSHPPAVRPQQVSPPVPPLADPSGRPRVADEPRRRETDALVDGLVIGHFLTRDQYRPRVDALEEELDRLRPDGEPWSDDWGGPVSDDPLADLDAELDHAEFDAMAGLGVEPWADELFDDGDEDED